MIQKRGSRWRVVVQGRRDELTGRRRQLSGSAATEREAVALERQLRLQAEHGLNGRMKLSELVTEWWGQGPRLSSTTLANYRSNLDVHILPLVGDRRLDEIRPRLVAQLLQHLGDKGLSASTQRKVRTVLSSVMSYAVAMEYLETNSVMKVPPPELEPAARVAPTLTETGRILIAAEEVDPDFHTFLWVAAEEGGRRGEILGLRWSDVDFARDTITIRSVVSAGIDGVQVRNRTKTKRERTIAISQITRAKLIEHRRVTQERLAAAGLPDTVPAEAFVFSGGAGSRRTLIDGQPWRPDSTSRRFRRIKEQAGVDPSITLHGLRHTMVTELLHAGADPRTVMGRAGHSSTATTMETYAKVRPSVDAVAAQQWGEQLRATVASLRAELAECSPRQRTELSVVRTA